MNSGLGAPDGRKRLTLNDALLGSHQNSLCRTCRIFREHGFELLAVEHFFAFTFSPQRFDEGTIKEKHTLESFPIVLSGPSGSGKTVAALQLADHVAGLDKETAVVGMYFAGHGIHFGKDVVDDGEGRGMRMGS